MSFEDLKRSVERGGVVVVAGAGCSIAATAGHATASWTGLIEHGIDYAVAHGSGLEPWAANVREALRLAYENESATELLQAASNTAAKIRGMGTQFFATWIRDAVGRLPIADRSWAEALGELGLPIFTTNYDDILERVVGAHAIDWQDVRGFQQILNDGPRAVGHLHGYFDRPESVILSEADYGRQMGSEGIQAIQRAVSASKSILYVGCGGTLEDPNFDALLRWHRGTFVDSGTRHFRLCREQELDALRETHRDSNIEPLSYGGNFTDLPAFLRACAPERAVARTAGGVIRDIIGDSRSHLLDQLRQETIVGEGLSDLDERPLEDLIVPPIFLPVPHQELVRAAADEKPKRLSVDDVLGDGVVLLIAEDGAGLSTAMRWLLLESSSRRQMPPIHLNFRTMPAGPKPLAKRLTTDAYQRGLISDRHEPVPPHVLGIDNFHAGNRAAERVSAELSSTPTKYVVVGCSSNDEAEVTDILKRSGVPVRVAYLGKLGGKEVRAMAEIATGGKAELLSQAVLNTMRSEHLPRTPFTVALLITVMSRGETVLNNISPTGVLDQYVNHLLGRDDPNQDSRRKLSAADLESILTDLATVFLEQDQGSILQSDIIRAMENFFGRYAWDESPRQVFDDLVRRRIFVEDGTQVRFTQSSFLHLFLAKAAAKDAELQERLLSRPLYYGASITAHAALSRNNREVLERIAPLVQDPPEPAGASKYEAREPRDAPENLPELLAIEPDENAKANEPDEPEDDTDPFDSLPDTDILPFPVNDDSLLSPITRYLQSLSLVSVVLRDSEEIADLELKKRVLIDVLRGWGHVSDSLYEDSSFQELIDVLREQTHKLDETPDDSWIEQVTRMLPDLLVFSSIQTSLASRKLIVSAREVAELPEVRNDPRTAIPAAILLERIDEKGWERLFGDLIEPYETTDVIENFVEGLLFMRFVEAPKGSALENALRELIARGYLARNRFQTVGHRSNTKSAYLTFLNTQKARAVPSELEGPDEI